MMFDTEKNQKYQELNMESGWKKNWEQAKENFSSWWNREGLVINQWSGVSTENPPHEIIKPVPHIDSHLEEYYANADHRVQKNHAFMASLAFPADIPATTNTYIGPGSLAMHLGSKPEFRKESVWYHPTMAEIDNPEKLPPLKFDENEKWWKIQEETLRKSVKMGKGKYVVGCPDLIENIDCLASLRGQSNLFMDMVTRPDWVKEKISEINQAYFEVYDRIYEIIKLEDGGSVYEAYNIYGPGKTAKVQCDNATMFSPKMFDEMCAPALTEQCEWLDYSLYHLDGKEEFVHLDTLLSIDALDGIEWTPNANLPLGGDPIWFDLYRRILNAGKCVQVYMVWPHEIIPVLDAIGGKGVQILALFANEKQVEETLKKVEQFR